MDHITRCPHCGHGLIPALSRDGRTEFSCIWCENLGSTKPDARKDGMLSARTSLAPESEAP